MIDKKVIILIGPICAGKGQVAQILHQYYGYTILRFSQILEEEMILRKIPIIRENYQQLGNDLRRELGSNALAIKLVDQINNKDIDKVVIDGARNPEEIFYIKNSLPNSTIISLVLEAPRQIRFQRLLERQRQGDPIKFEDFQEKDDIEMYGDGTPHSQRIIDCIKVADFKIENTKNLEHLQQQLENILKSNNLT